MSVLLQNRMLENIFSGISGGSSNQLPNNFGGLNLSSLNLGGGSSGAGSIGGLAGLGSLFGPVGTGVGSTIGIVSNLIPGLDGFIKNGFDLTCIGSQAFNKSDLDAKMSQMSGLAETAKKSVSDMGQFLHYLHNEIQEGNLEINRYSSGCSKKLRTQVVQSAQSIYDSIDKSGFTVTEWTNKDFKGASYQTKGFTPKIGVTNVNQNIPTPTIEEFNMVLKPEIEKYALQNGLDVNSTIETAYNSLFGNGGGLNGGISGGINTNGDWQVGGSLGNTKDNTTLYVMGGLALLVVYFVAKKK